MNKHSVVVDPAVKQNCLADLSLCLFIASISLNVYHMYNSIWNGIIYRWCAITLTSFPSFFPTQKLQKERTSDSIYNNHQIPQYRVRKKNRTINVSRPAYFCNGFTLSAPSLKFSTMVPWSPRAISLLIFSGKGSRPVNPPPSLITETASIQ